MEYFNEEKQADLLKCYDLEIGKKIPGVYNELIDFLNILETEYQINYPDFKLENFVEINTGENTGKPKIEVKKDLKMGEDDTRTVRNKIITAMYYYFDDERIRYL